MLRWSCLITAIVVSLLFLVMLGSCRSRGLPFSQEVGTVGQPATHAGFDTDDSYGARLFLKHMA